jgi:hypothetical protein
LPFDGHLFSSTLTKSPQESGAQCQSSTIKLRRERRSAIGSLALQQAHNEERTFLAMDQRVKWSVAACAGLVAGIVATVFEIALWALLTDSLPENFSRDARLAAAIVMGRRVLGSALDWQVVAVAMLVHFALSITYGLILSTLIGRVRITSSLAVGAAFGLCLYALNMYGFTILFPWFEATRDAITIATHLAFGIVAAGVYRLLAHGALPGMTASAPRPMRDR